MVGTTENQHDTMSTGLSQKESTGLSQPYNSIYSMYVFPGNMHIRIHIYIYIHHFAGAMIIFGGEKNVWPIYFTANPSLCPKKKRGDFNDRGKWPTKKEHGIKGTEYIHQKAKNT